jgi:hypothetical protein
LLTTGNETCRTCANHVKVRISCLDFSDSICACAAYPVVVTSSSVPRMPLNNVCLYSDIVRQHDDIKYKINVQYIPNPQWAYCHFRTPQQLIRKLSQFSQNCDVITRVFPANAFVYLVALPKLQLIKMWISKDITTA